MNFGFSYVGLLFLVLLFVPNLIWMRNKPSGYEEQAAHESKALLVFERLGEALVTCAALVFRDFNPSGFSWRELWLAAALLMLLYEVYWARYFRSGRTLKDFYSSLCGVPVAGATLPFFCWGSMVKTPFCLPL